MSEPSLQSQADDDWRETRDAWFLVGPTAAGKTQVGLVLAERIGAEVLSLDSMALFRGLDVGTAKPSAAEQARVPHHLIDILEPHQDFSLAEYVRAAADACRHIRARGRIPLFVGGTPLYLKALLRGIFQGPEPDWQLRNQLEAEGAAKEAGYLHARLAQIDPAAAARLHVTDTRRIIRAIEVFTKTGRPISELQQQFDRARAAGECHVYWLDWPRDQLYARINRRVEQMFSDGLVEEVQRLCAKCSADQSLATAAETVLSRTALQAVGYREVIEMLSGRHDLKATIELVQNRTRAFARRQHTWLRSLSECRVVSVCEPLDPREAAERIIATNDSRIEDQPG